MGTRSSAGLTLALAMVAGCSLVFDTEGAATGGGGSGGSAPSSTSGTGASTSSSGSTTSAVSSTSSSSSTSTTSSTTGSSMGCDQDQCQASCGPGSTGDCVGNDCVCDCDNQDCQQHCFFEMQSAAFECQGPTCLCCPQPQSFGSPGACDAGCEDYCGACSADCLSTQCQCGD